LKVVLKKDATASQNLHAYADMASDVILSSLIIEC